jgi:perosamine synthetase
MPTTDHEIPLSRPDISELEEELVLQVLRSGRLAIGPMQEEFERLCAEASGCRYGVACSSGTSGLHLVMRSLGIGPGDEVITTPFSFIASSNCILFVGAKPVFVDICPKTLNMDPYKLEEAITPRTKAVLLCSPGNPSGVVSSKRECEDLLDLCKRRNLLLISDEIYDEFTFDDFKSDKRRGDGSAVCPSPARLAGGSIMPRSIEGIMLDVQPKPIDVPRVPDGWR